MRGKPLLLQKSFSSLDEFDSLVTRLSNEERAMRLDIKKYMGCKFDDEFFRRWYEVLYEYNLEKVKQS